MDIRMHYGKYKDDPLYSQCDTRRDSYDPETKTILVSVPEKYRLARAIYDLIPQEEVERLTNGSQWFPRREAALFYAECYLDRRLDLSRLDEFPAWGKAIVHAMAEVENDKGGESQ